MELPEDLSKYFEWRDGQYWLLSDNPKENSIGISIDLELERHQAYFKKSSVHKELLARSVGIKGSHRPHVLDLTAGMLGDSLLLLSMGCEVVAVERNPLVRVLIRSALEKATHPLLSKFHFLESEAMAALQYAKEVVFFDPMFEDANDKALPRKEMRIFRQFIGSDADAKSVFDAALKLGLKRLVVKRPRHSVALGENPLQYTGKATRYDVYLGQNNIK
jgi:16S rRNA (guanine1516-N2)-methyltransferase